MHSGLLGIFRGQSFATADGEEFTVLDLDPTSGYAVIETLKDEQGVMDLGGMLEAIHNGVLVSLDEKSDSEDT
jgi:hypothetical protein